MNDPIGTKTVVFVSGADFSGTTMLDLMLGSAFSAISIGEIHAYFRPTKREHLSKKCSCGKVDCEAWHGLEALDETSIYQAIFASNDHVTHIIDSSKSLPWIRKMSRVAKLQGYEVRHVLIWKNPEDYAISCRKRGRGRRWATKWMNYNRAYISIVEDFYTIAISDLLGNYDIEMKAICDWVGLDYDKSMREYWLSSHHLLFGSATAGLMLHKDGSREKENVIRSSLRFDINDSPTNEVRNDKDQKLTARMSKKITHLMRLLSGNGRKSVGFDRWRMFYYAAYIKNRALVLVLMIRRVLH